jgi:hypothetical protein
MYLLSQNKPGGKLKDVISIISITGIFYAILVVINLLLGDGPNKVPKALRNSTTQGLIFPPRSVATYSTPEFNYTVAVNELGLRDKEISIAKGNTYRILCIGDSWTLGWGVNQEDSWPEKLETYLNATGTRKTEVINGGQPGAFTSVYLDNIARAVPLLKPDLVLVGVLQMDDMVQLYEQSSLCTTPLIKGKEQKGMGSKISYAALMFLKYSFGNILKAVSSQILKVDQEVNKRSVSNMTEALSETETRNYKH